MPEVSLVIPVHDGAGFLEERLGELSRFMQAEGFDYEIVAVDDGSTDESPEILRRLTIPHVRAVLSRPNRGKFSAIRLGMQETTGRCRIFTDADVPYDFTAIPRAVHLVARRRFHIVVGDRSLPGSVYTAELAPIRRAATETFTLCVRLFVTSGLGDTQCGFKAIRGDVADALFPLMQENRFAGDVELLYIALKHNLDIKRIPVKLRYQGPSSVKPVRDGVAMLKSLLAIRHRHRRGAYDSIELRRLAEAYD